MRELEEQSIENQGQLARSILDYRDSRVRFKNRLRSMPGVKVALADRSEEQAEDTDQDPGQAKAIAASADAAEESGACDEHDLQANRKVDGPAEGSERGQSADDRSKAEVSQHEKTSTTVETGAKVTEQSPATSSEEVRRTEPAEDSRSEEEIAAAVVSAGPRDQEIGAVPPKGGEPDSAHNKSEQVLSNGENGRSVFSNDHPSAEAAADPSKADRLHAIQRIVSLSDIVVADSA